LVLFLAYPNLFGIKALLLLYQSIGLFSSVIAQNNKAKYKWIKILFVNDEKPQCRGKYLSF
jgi:hypothetical protein